jgi:hypothetical protein
VVQAVRRDRDEVLEPLLERILTWADLLDQGVRVPSPVIQEALRLVHSFHANLRSPRIRQLGMLASITVPDDTHDLVGLLMEEFELSKKRTAPSDWLLSDFERGIPGADGRLATDLRELVEVERAWQKSTEMLALRLPKIPSDVEAEALEKVGVPVAQSRALRQVERTGVEAYLESTKGILQTARKA